MIKATRWKPDTCECVIEYEWDDAETENVRIHEVINVVKACMFHQLDKQSTYAQVLKENKGKNITLGAILDLIPSLVEDKIQEDGTILKQFKRGIEPKWSFDNDRKLHVEFPTDNKPLQAVKTNLSNVIRQKSDLEVVFE